MKKPLFDPRAGALVPLAACVLFLFSAPVDAQIVGGKWNTTYQFDGDSANDYLGFSVDTAGDTNGDGVPDFVVGAYGDDPLGLNAAGSAAVYSGLDGAKLLSFSGEIAGDAFGYSVAGAGDVNADGYDDVIMGAYLANASWRVDSGAAYVASGLDGSLLYQFDGQVDGDNLGFSVDGAGDVDADGYDDLIVGAFAASPNGVSKAGSVFVLSGVDGSEIYRFDGTSISEWLGFSVAGVGDVNADGFADVIVGAPYAASVGAATVYSGIDGSVLYTFPGFGRAVCGAGDVNRDGYDDIICGSSTAAPEGRAEVYSGADGSLLFTFDGERLGDDFGDAVGGAGDLDNDEHPDLIIGAPFGDPGGRTDAGIAYVYSGFDGSLLRSFKGDNNGDRLGRSVAFTGDINGDSHDDFIVGMDGANPNNRGDAGGARVFSLRPYFILDAVELSASNGVPVIATCEFPITEAGFSYIVLASGTGTGPTTVGGVEIPLTPDGIYNLILSGNAPPQLVDAYGTLNFQGDAEARLLSDPALAAFIGRKYFVAAVSYDPRNLAPRQSSVAKPVTIVP